MAKNPPEIMHKKILRMLAEKRFTQVGLAQKLGVTEQRVSKWLSQGTGFPDPYKLKAMADLFEVPMEWFVDDTTLDPPLPLSTVDSAPGLSREEEHVLYLSRAIGVEEAIRRMAMAPPTISYAVPGYQDEKKEPSRRRDGTGK